MASKPIVSMNKVAERIVELNYEGDMTKIYRNLRQLVNDGILQSEGVEVFSQEAIRGNHKFTYHFSDCERTIEIYRDQFLNGSTYGHLLVQQTIRTIENNQVLRATFPKRLLESLKKFANEQS